MGLLDSEEYGPTAPQPGFWDRLGGWAERQGRAGTWDGLLSMGAAIADAGRPRLLLREGFGPGIGGAIANGAAAFGQGMTQGRNTRIQQGLLEQRLQDENDWRNRINQLPEADRALYRAMGPQRGAQSLIEDQRQQRQAQEAQRFLGGLMGGGGASSPTPGGFEQAPVANASDTSQPRGLRNNNPLNIEAGNFTQRLPGFQGSDGRFARFESMDQGIAAADQLLQSYAARGLNTPAAIVGRWAPAGDGNNVSAYAGRVAQALGVKPDEPINMQDAATRRKLIEAMAQVENGRPLTTPAVATQTGGGQAGGITPQQIMMAAASGNPMLQRFATAAAPFVRQDARAEGPASVYGNPQWGVDENGQPVLVQQDNRGNWTRAQIPAGVTLTPPTVQQNTGTSILTTQQRTGAPVANTPINIRGREAEERIGAQQGTAAAAAPQAIQNTENALRLVDEVRNHRALTASTGLTGPIVSALPGTPMYDFRTRVQQLQGQNFLQAFESLKGGGAITEMEGRKATEAIARLNQGLSERDFRQALDDLSGILRQGMERAQRAQANGGTGRPDAAPGGQEPVRVSSPDEARRLPSGTPILLPDGTTGRVP